MKRYIAGLACAATAMLGVPALASTAHAQAADPISALKKQFKNGRGVTYVDTTKGRTSSESAVMAQRKGVFQFGASGINASDQTTKLRIKTSDIQAITENLSEEESKLLVGLTKPERVIRVKNTSYVSGGVFGQFLPEDKPWLKLPGFLGNTGRLSQLVNPAEPATLRALLARATVKRPTAYSGKITFGELYKVSPWFRAGVFVPPTAKQSKIVVQWKLVLGSDLLARRLTTTYSGAAVSAAPGVSVTVETRYTGWGSKVTVKAPPADQIAKPDDLGEGVETDAPIPLLSHFLAAGHEVVALTRSPESAAKATRAGARPLL
ncbi:hypothetical protein, partial [Streptosporangium sp. NPDC048865]|uniref:hypothetical protein n=1 Tax=Streptosporangium sp. NPDC048865 TaxID=3155766 RepID=UPI0034411D07